MIPGALVVLAVLAYMGRSLVMLASVAGMAVALWITRNRPFGLVLVGLLLGGVGVALLAEVVHVVYHRTQPVPPDHGGFWMSAILVGLINVAAMLPPAAWAEYRKRHRGPGALQEAPEGPAEAAQGGADVT